mmetsp:Transcript_28039/g.42418  ORF Transcript_28039/g.42418 Transcript_28039/m.42418 type:complete len:81 (-) Transcript_28039:25-267(-)
MALRRPPTRIELRIEDMEEYEEKKRRQEALDGNAVTMDSKMLPSPNEEARNRRKAVAERIGMHPGIIGGGTGGGSSSSAR